MLSTAKINSYLLVASQSTLHSLTVTVLVDVPWLVNTLQTCRKELKTRPVYCEYTKTL